MIKHIWRRLARAVAPHNGRAAYRPRHSRPGHTPDPTAHTQPAQTHAKQALAAHTRAAQTRDACARAGKARRARNRHVDRDGARPVCVRRLGVEEIAENTHRVVAALAERGIGRLYHAEAPGVGVVSAPGLTIWLDGAVVVARTARAVHRNTTDRLEALLNAALTGCGGPAGPVPSHDSRREPHPGRPTPGEPTPGGQQRGDQRRGGGAARGTRSEAGPVDHRRGHLRSYSVSHAMSGGSLPIVA